MGFDLVTVQAVETADHAKFQRIDKEDKGYFRHGGGIMHVLIELGIAMQTIKADRICGFAISDHEEEDDTRRVVSSDEEEEEEEHPSKKSKKAKREKRYQVDKNVSLAMAMGWNNGSQVTANECIMMAEAILADTDRLKEAIQTEYKHWGYSTAMTDQNAQPRTRAA